MSRVVRVRCTLHAERIWILGKIWQRARYAIDNRRFWTCSNSTQTTRNCKFTILKTRQNVRVDIARLVGRSVFARNALAISSTYVVPPAVSGRARPETRSTEACRVHTYVKNWNRRKNNTSFWRHVRSSFGSENERIDKTPPNTPAWNPSFPGDFDTETALRYGRYGCIMGKRPNRNHWPSNYYRVASGSKRIRILPVELLPGQLKSHYVWKIPGSVRIGFFLKPTTFPNRH